MHDRVATTTSPEKTLLIFSTATLDEMLAKGNVWYLRHYEAYFDRTVAAYMFGDAHEPQTRGTVTLLSIGTGGRGWYQYFTLPWRVYKCARDVRPTSYLSGDTLFYWWTFSLIRWFLGAKVVLMPVYLLEEVYKGTARSVTGLPRWLERLFACWSFAVADRVLTAESCGRFVGELSSRPAVRRKLIVTQTVVDALPTVSFFEELAKARTEGPAAREPRAEFRLVTISRLHEQKLPADLVRMMGCLREFLPPGAPRVTLTFFGDGPEQPRLEALAAELGVQDAVIFAGSVPNEQLPRRLLPCDAFVSAVTGTALREAALCSLPLVCYNTDWLQGFLRHEQDALLAPRGDYRELARQVARLVQDEPLRRRMADGATSLAERFFTPTSLRASLEEVFGR